jgi:hypothetical protein
MRLRHFCWSVLRITMAIVAIAGGDALLQHLLHAPPGIMLGATLGTNVLTLADWAKRIGPDNEVATITARRSERVCLRSRGGY